MSFNMSSIMGKVETWSKSPEGKRRIKECLEKYEKEGRTVTNAGGRLRSEEMMYEVAYKFITLLRSTAQNMNLPDSVLEHFDSLDCSRPLKRPDGKTALYVYFKDNLHRDSLRPDKYSGVDNIIAVLNNGYDKHENMAKVWGIWHDVRVHALTERTGLRFIQQAVNTFNDEYGAYYGVTAISGDDYR